MKNNPLRGKTLDDVKVYEDTHFIIINKPSGISTLEDRNDPLNILSLARKDDPAIKVGHRLDKNTSGLLVLAKNETAYCYFSTELANRNVFKLYHAVVCGIARFDEEEINLPIYTTSNKSRIDYRTGKPSITIVSTLAFYKKHTLVACMPFTGRMHQIRVHLTYLKYPIVGDPMYHGKDIYLSEIKRNYHKSKDKDELPLIQRMALHAHGLSFKSLSGEQINIQAEYPKDFRALVRQLEKNK